MVTQCLKESELLYIKQCDLKDLSNKDHLLIKVSLLRVIAPAKDQQGLTTEAQTK